MRKWRYTSVIAIVMAFCVLCSGSMKSGALERSENGTESITQRYSALEMINRTRSSMGLQALVMDEALNAMAQNHSQYMNAAKVVSFEELSDNEYYTGAYPLDRSSYFNYTKDYVSEYNQQRMASYTDCLEWCIQDPYLRTRLLSPEYTDIGMGKDGSYYSIEIGGNGYNGSSTIVVYPYAGQQNVDNLTKAEMSRIPDMLELNESQAIGIPITLQYYNEGLMDVSFENIRVQVIDTRKQTEVETIVVAPQDENAVQNTLILFPTERYQASTGYSVSVRFDVWYKDVLIESVDEKWSFTSAGPDYMGEVNRKNAIMSLAEALKIPEEDIDEIDIALQYNDVQIGDEEFNLLYKLKKDGVLSSSDRVFNPREFTTREQAVVWLIDMLKAYAPNVVERVELDYRDTFADINQCSEEAMDAVQMAYQMGLIQDQGHGIFNPKVQITKAEMDAIVEKVSKGISISWPETEEGEENSADAEDKS